MNKQFLNKITLGDALVLIKDIEDDSIDLVLTDPPYFLDKLDNNWDSKTVSSKKNQQTVKSLPAGMKFDRKQGVNFYNWYIKVSKEVFRILKPGGFFFSFSSPRLYHRMTSAIDDVGFEIRDAFLWIYTRNQAKAMSLDHFIESLDTTIEQKNIIKEKFKGWKTPQLKSCYEPIAVAQKPTDGTFLNNILKYENGLLNTQVKVGNNMFPSNVLTIDYFNNLFDCYFLIPKPDKKEKGFDNHHNTVKPVTLCEHLIKLTTFSKDAIIFDPFVGSGTTAVAAKKLAKNFIGFDLNPEYVEISNSRLTNLQGRLL